MLDYELFAVLIPYEYESYPLAYLSLERRSEPRDRKNAISKFLHEIKELNISPSTFLTDKDEGQISAITANFPNSCVQLCFWHTLQAIKRKMNAAGFSEE